MSAPVDYFIAFANTFGTLAAPFVDPLRATTASLLRHSPLPLASADRLLHQLRSPLAERLPLMDPFNVVLIVLAYFATVRFGTAAMASRKKFAAKNFSLAHNTFLTALSAYMGIAILAEASRKGYSLFGNPADASEDGWPMAKLIWLFYFSKIFEFTDTVIMILKKNNHQISFLHVYHHSSIFLVWWFVTSVAPNGEAYFSAMLNSFIHVIMYGYYFLSAIGVKQVAFVKRYITMCQMTQFCMMMVQATYNMIDGYLLRPQAAKEGKVYPLYTSVLLWVYMVTMLGLFYNFFRQDAKKRRAAALSARDGKKAQ